MDFSLPDDLIELKERTERFVRDRIIPFEADPRQSAHGPNEDLRGALVALGREAGLLSPHVGRDWGGLGLDHRGKAVVFEAAGYSPLGPVALNCFAPDEGNMHLLEEVAEQRQKEQWLRSMATGQMRSCFMMTEPAPGAGADPSMLLTTARRDGDEFVIDGRKWLITGAVGADLGIVMARNESDKGGPAGATMFLTPMSASGTPDSAASSPRVRARVPCSARSALASAPAARRSFTSRRMTPSGRPCPWRRRIRRRRERWAPEYAARRPTRRGAGRRPFAW